MDSKRLNELKKLAEAATPGPWGDNIWCGDYDNVWAATGPVHKQKPDEDELSDSSDAAVQAEADAAFIAASRGAVPELITEVERLKIQREKLIYAMVAARNEIGVPQPGYPAPVANAYEWLVSALRAVDAS